MNWVIMLIIALVVSYLIGSINFALIVSKIFVKKDVRKMGSGNAGMTNVIRTVGIVPGIITFVGDFGKGLAAPLIAKFLLFPYIAENAPDFIANFLTPEYGVYFCGFLCIIGHAYPIFFGFRGGKGVSTSIAVLFCINWIVAAFVLTTFLVLFLITKIISIGSVLGAVEFPIFNIADIFLTLGCIALGVYILFLHDRAAAGERIPSGRGFAVVASADKCLKAENGKVTELKDENGKV